MTKIIATFSNGFTDKYNGKRDVKAAWLITENGWFYASGHSNDALAAAKTAASSLPRVHRTFRGTMSLGCIASVMALYVRPTGCKSLREYNDFASKANAAEAAKYKIEIINL